MYIQQIRMLFAILALFMLSCGGKSEPTDSSNSASGISYGKLTDSRDNHVYKTVVIGTQTWMAENLAYLPSVGAGFYVFDYYGNDVVKAKASIYYTSFGVLYSWPAAMAHTELPENRSSAIQGICPEGWHLPSKDEFDLMLSYLGGDSIAGVKVKSVSGWGISGSLGTDDYGFSALPSGYWDAGFHELGYSANWWTSHTESEKAQSWNDTTAYQADSWSLGTDGRFNIVTVEMSKGLSVRCVQGQGLAPPSSSSAITYGSLIDTRDSHTYKTVVIGTQTWMAENLAYLPSVIEEGYYVDGYEGTDPLMAKATNYYKTYGVLYDFYAARAVKSFYDLTLPNEVQGVCPVGWHLPNGDEWRVLVNYLGGDSIAGAKAKEATGWGAGTNDYGFSALPGGSHFCYGEPPGIGNKAGWWASSWDCDIGRGCDLKINRYAESWSIGIGLRFDGATSGMDCAMSVRCLKYTQPSSSSSAISYGTMIDARDNRTYKTVLIGTQTWMAENLAYLPSINSWGDTSSIEPKYYVEGYKDSSLSEAKASINYKTYGVLYNWPAAAGGQIYNDTNVIGIQGVCPQGWHVPSGKDWGILLNEVWGPYGFNIYENLADTSMRGGTNTYGFSAVNSIFEWWIGDWDSEGAETIYIQNGVPENLTILYFGMGTRPGSAVRCIQD